MNHCDGARWDNDGLKTFSGKLKPLLSELSGNGMPWKKEVVATTAIVADIVAFSDGAAQCRH